MPSLKTKWQNYATPTKLLDYFVCGVAKYAFPTVFSPLMYATITNPVGMAVIYDITTADVGLALLTSHLGHSFFRAVHKRKYNDIAVADSLSTPWHQEPIRKSSLLKTFAQDVFSLPRPLKEYKEQKFAYRHDGHMNKLRLKADSAYASETRLNNAQAPRPR